MIYNNLYICPVCGFQMEQAPSNYNICPCCGTEFGNDDAFRTHAELRQDWISGGMKWWYDREPAPDGWNPSLQLARNIPSD